MRPIKFRAWDKDIKSMFYDVSIRDNHFCVYRKSEGLLSISGIICEESSIVLMQFTGLCDQNGKDLDWWEGDEFKMHGWSIPWVIVKEQGCFWFKSTTTSERRLAYRVAEYAIQLEKIGTIHENPELLEKVT